MTVPPQPIMEGERPSPLELLRYGVRYQGFVGGHLISGISSTAKIRYPTSEPADVANSQTFMLMRSSKEGDNTSKPVVGDPVMYNDHVFVVFGSDGGDKVGDRVAASSSLDSFIVQPPMVSSVIACGSTVAWKLYKTRSCWRIIRPDPSAHDQSNSAIPVSAFVMLVNCGASSASNQYILNVTQNHSTYSLATNEWGSRNRHVGDTVASEMSLDADRKVFVPQAASDDFADVCMGGCAVSPWLVQFKKGPAL